MKPEFEFDGEENNRIKHYRLKATSENIKSVPFRKCIEKKELIGLIELKYSVGDLEFTLDFIDDILKDYL